MGLFRLWVWRHSTLVNMALLIDCTYITTVPPPPPKLYINIHLCGCVCRIPGWKQLVIITVMGRSRKFELESGEEGLGKYLTIYQVNRPFLCNFLRNIPKFFKSWQWVQTPLDLHLVVMFEVVLYVESGIQIKELLGQLLSLTVYSQTVLHAHSIQRLHMLQVMQKIQQSSHCFNVSAQK